MDLELYCHRKEASMMIRRVDAVVLFVENRASCTAFYRDTLGLPATFSDANSDGFKLGDQDFIVLDVAAAAEMVGEEAMSFHKEAVHRVLGKQVD